MKQLMIALMMVLVSVVSAQAQMDSSMHCEHEAQLSGQGMMMEPCQQMPIMQHMMKNKMMMQEMMGMMKDTLKIQQRLLEGVKSAEKKNGEGVVRDDGQGGRHDVRDEKRDESRDEV